MPTIQLLNVAKVYKSNDINKFSTLSDINLTIQQGEFVFFIGSRGAGTTVLLNMIAGNVSPDSGSVFLDDSKTQDKKKAKLRRSVFGVVPQESGLIRTETVFQNICTQQKFSGIKNCMADPFRIRKSLGLVGMAGCEQKYPVELSIPECKKIELAKAILYSPHILVLDKITDRMDPDSIWDVMQLLIELNQRGTTILMSTHAKQVVNIMRKRIVTLANGKIVGDVQKGKFGDII